MQTREENVDKWLAKTIRTIITVAQGEWLVEMSKGLQLVPADTKKGQAEHYAIVVPWESSSMEVRLDGKIPAHVNSYSVVIKYAIKCGCPIASATGTQYLRRGRLMIAICARNKTYVRQAGRLHGFI